MSTIHKLHRFLFSFARTAEKSLQEKLGITFPQFMILLAIKNNPHCTQATVAAWRKLTPAAISQHVNTLIAKKLIVKKNNSKDRREHSIVLTPKGLAIFKKALVIYENAQKNIFKKVSARSISDMNKTLDALLVQMDTSSMPSFIKNI
jgi:DNA-binding MarR family transcriptional regulator